MYRQLFQKILDASQNHSLTFFVGAGISTISGAPKWSELISAFCEEMRIKQKESLSTDDYLRYAQMFYNHIGKDNDKYYTFIEKHIGTNLNTNEVHKMMLHFNPTSFITTNYDELLEKAALEECKSYKCIACESDISSINGNKYILKIHGDINHKNIVLKEEDYLNYSENFKLTETLLKSIFSTNTVVFIGYGLNDYNIKLILNWAKNLLKDNFNKPIFIHTGTEQLSKSELEYHKSRGLDVIEYQKCIDGEISKDYTERYLSVLNTINQYSDYHFSTDDKLNNLHVLFNLLSPLDKMNALRFSDIQSKLYPYVIIEDTGAIRKFDSTINVFQYFMEINALCEKEYEVLPENTKKEYELILRVLSKSRIHYYNTEHKNILIKNIDNLFANKFCLLFDYKAMNKFVSLEYKGIYENYIKAYYLAKLKRYYESFLLYSQVATESFQKGEYLLYYFSQINRKNLFIVLKSMRYNPFYCQKYDISTLEKEYDEKQNNNIFEYMPLEFKRDYSFLKDVCSDKLLYKFSYEAFIDGEKLRKSIESNSIEMGMTSSGKVVSQINNYLHFLTGNFIFLDEFNEFKNTVKNLMSLLAYKYYIQDKKTLMESAFGGIQNEKIKFDYIDFYCFIEFLSKDDIKSLFNRYQLRNVEFDNIDCIGVMIKNIINYYNTTIKNSEDNLQRNTYETRLKSLIALLMYCKLPQNLVDCVCDFILNNEFREIYINDKILFLDAQVYRNKKYSNKTNKIIEKRLLYYLDQHLLSIKENKEFDIRSTSNRINYYNLANYLENDNKKYSSYALSKHVKSIIDNNYEKMRSYVFDHYYHLLPKTTQKKVVNWAKIMIAKEFSFDLFTFLIDKDEKVIRENFDSLKAYLKSKCEKETSKTSHQIQLSPIENCFEELIQIGYWCLSGYIDSNCFDEFVGLCDQFDFYYLYESFDYSKFDVQWLANLYPHTYECIAKNDAVKKAIREKIVEALKKDEYKPNDKQILTSILSLYFC